MKILEEMINDGTDLEVVCNKRLQKGIEDINFYTADRKLFIHNGILCVLWTVNSTVQEITEVNEVCYDEVVMELYITDCEGNDIYIDRVGIYR